MKRFFLCILMLVSIMACEKGNENGNENGNGNGNNPEEPKGTPKECSIHGFAQKGQFVKGSQVTAFAVGKDLVATGESFPANISDDLGAFSISGKTAAPYLELRAEGYYFNEMAGEVSSSPIYLEAFVKSNDQSANINLLTTIIRPRVKKLIAGGKTYDDAVKQAQQEVLSSKFISDIGFTGSVASFDDLDIVGTQDADAMLFVLACRVLYNRSASEITTLIQELASELETDGKISYIELVNGGYQIYPFSVLDNLAKYYAQKNITVTTVPPFWKYCDDIYKEDFVINDFSMGEVYPSPIKTPDAVGATYNIISTIEFSVEANRNDVVLEKQHILGPAYRVSVSIPANTGDEAVHTRVTFKDKSGKELAIREFDQGPDVQYLILRSSGGNTKAVAESYFNEGDVVSVNGSNYTLVPMEAFGGMPCVMVPHAESFIVSSPAGKVSGGGHIARAKVTLEAENTMSPQMYYYGALAPYSDIPISNPGQVTMFPCLAVLGVRVIGTYANSWKYIEITPNAENEYLAGTASYVVNEQDKAYFPELNPNIEVENGIRTKRIINDNSDETAYCVTFPQELSQGFKVSVFGQSGEELLSKSTSQTLRLGVGGMIVFNIQ
ncbi:MAG: hypothetical protein ILA23_02065 [Bacteroidales bacterium]|nr:hypothetical protein [Bacteroidales bacterium]